ncbi:MAG: hypothetical protein ACK5LC_05160 [Coprobacillaceae bacterium]
MKKIKCLGIILLCVIALTGCSSDADVVSKNLSTDADQFKILRRVVVVNSITGEYLYEVQGNISITKDNEDNQLEIIAKIGNDEYKKDFIGLNEVTTYVVEQLEWVEADKYKYTVIFKPDSIIPIEFDLE